MNELQRDAYELQHSGAWERVMQTVEAEINTELASLGPGDVDTFTLLAHEKRLLDRLKGRIASHLAHLRESA